MRPSCAFLLAALLVPVGAAAADEPAPVSPAVPATAGPGEAEPTAVPIAGERELEQLPGPIGALPGLPGAPVEPLDFARPARASRSGLGFHPEVVVPLGDWTEIAGPGLGLNVVYEYLASPGLALTGRLGYVVHLEDEKMLGARETDLHTHEVPLLAGVRFSPLRGFYGAVEAGLVHFRTEHETDDSVDTGGGFRLGGTIGAGYRLADFDFGARLFLPDLVGRDDGASLSTGLSFQIGYAFADL